MTAAYWCHSWMLRARKMKVIPASSSHFQARGRHFSDQLALGKEVGEARLTSSKQVSLERQGSSWDSIIFPEEFGPWIHTVPQAHTMWGKLQSVRTPYRTLMTSRPWYFLSLSYLFPTTFTQPHCRLHVLDFILEVTFSCDTQASRSFLPGSLGVRTSG